MAGDGVELPIFELPLVLLPGELLPLHIFEERYKRMVATCLETRAAVRDRVPRRGRRRPADRLRGAGDRGHRALRRRPPQHRRHRRAPVPRPRPLRGGRLPGRRGRAGRLERRRRARGVSRGSAGRVRRAGPQGRRRAASGALRLRRLRDRRPRRTARRDQAGTARGAFRAGADDASSPPRSAPLSTPSPARATSPSGRSSTARS